MAFDEGLAQRIRELLGDDRGISEKRMFGGVCFTLGGHMMVGVTADRLMVRVGPQAHAEALRRRGARPMDFTGKPMRGYVFVDAPALAADRDLAEWITLARAFVDTLPPKERA
jgi:TfoX/Sxy family transcriptional regulator of competence genes